MHGIFIVSLLNVNQCHVLSLFCYKYVIAGARAHPIESKWENKKNCR